MKKFFYFLVLCGIWIINLGGCGDEDKKCEPCQNGGIMRGNPPDCWCDCPPGYSGSLCQNQTNTNRHTLNADIEIIGGSKYNYIPDDCFIHVYDHATDTVWIDGFDTGSVNAGFCFLRLYISNHTSITNGSSFPIKMDNSIGSCWASYRKDGATDAYTPDPSTVGTLTILEYLPGIVISGTFDFYAKDGSSTAHITGWFEDYD